MTVKYFGLSGLLVIHVIYADSIRPYTQSFGDCFPATYDILKIFSRDCVITDVESYIHEQQQRLDQLKIDVAEFEMQHKIAKNASEFFLQSSINAFLLIERLTSGWIIFEDELHRDLIGKGLLTNLWDDVEILYFPTYEDLSGAAAAIIRIQETYNLDSKQIALGMIEGIQVSYREFTVEDCFELGRQCYYDSNYNYATLWFNEAFTKFNIHGSTSIKRYEILEFLAFTTFTESNLERAIELTQLILEDVPEHEQALKNLIGYEEMLDREEKNDLEDPDPAKWVNLEENIEASVSDNYKRLCRGEGQISANLTKQFFCFYKDGPSYFLRIAPVKSEIVYINPTIVLYHQVISDSDVEYLQHLSAPRLERAYVQNYSQSDKLSAAYRISKSAWLDDHEVLALNKRIGIITGMTMESAEELQVGNYGIGGHYTSHYDYAREDAIPTTAKYIYGNRIATWMFYLSNVALGGATVFPFLELSIWPERGSAVFWLNMLPNGKCDNLTRHGGCPVIVGHKWVANKWIHEGGQEDSHPCSLKYDDKWDLTRV